MSVNNETFNNNGIIAWNCNSSKKVYSPTTDANFNEIKKTKPSGRSCCDICTIGSLLLFGFIFLTFGVLTTKFTLFEIVLRERLEMKTIYPSFFWWKNPEPEVLLKVYIFNITNSAEFIAGTDKKLKLQEIGPITFQEVLQHKDVVFHDENSTLSYTVRRHIVFKESANVKGILEQIVTVPNMASLSGCSSVAGSYFTRKLFNAALVMHKTSPVTTTSINNYFFNLTDSVLKFSSTFAPSLVPTTEMGILTNIYKHFTDRVNVKIGARHGNENFFKINTWNFRPTVPRFYPENGDCNANIEGSNEGALFPQMVTKESVLWYWRKTLCRAVPLHFDREVQVGKLKGYKFQLRQDVYDRSKNKSADCYKGSNLPDGLSDLSKCFFDQPIVASFPHFLNRPGNFTERLEGLKPNKKRHESYAIIEPTLGVPLNQRATSQSNVVTNDLSGFKSDIARFSDMVIPMFWLSVTMEKVTPLIISTVDFIVNTLPKIQYWISGGAIVTGLCLLMMGYLRLRNNEAIEDEEKMKKKKGNN